MPYDGKRLYVDDEAKKDMTEAVQIIFDLAHGSMDWGSGMLDNEEMTTVIEFAIYMGWKPPVPAYNTLPMVRLAANYPEHYDVYYKVLSGPQLGEDRLVYNVVSKDTTPYAHGGWTKLDPERMP